MMNAEIPWYHDPIVAEYEHPGDTLRAIRNGSLDLFCGYCGVMGKRGVWITANEVHHIADGSPVIQCPHCGEYGGMPIVARGTNE